MIYTDVNFSYAVLQVMRVSETIIHPNYTTGKLELGYDIALLMLPEAVHDIPIPSLASPQLTLHSEMTLFTLGWGQLNTSSTALAETLRVGTRSTVLRHGSRACQWDDTLFFCLSAEGQNVDGTCKGIHGVCMSR